MSAALGSLRRAGCHWFGPDKSRAITNRTARALIKQRLMFQPHGGSIRLTKAGAHIARTLVSQRIAASLDHTAMGEA